MNFTRSPAVLWDPVGLDGEEILLVREGDETDIYIISGGSGTGIWARLNGNNTAEDIADDMAGTGVISRTEALKLVEAFISDLLEYGLIQEQKTQKKAADTKELPLPPWPVRLSTPTLKPFRPEKLVSSELVAVGTFQGSQNNAGGAMPCSGGDGGINNAGGVGPCRPGPGHGFINAGWIGVPCRS